MAWYEAGEIIGNLFGVALFALLLWKILSFIRNTNARLTLSILGALGIAWGGNQALQTPSQEPAQEASGTPRDIYDVSSFGNAPKDSDPVVPGVTDNPISDPNARAARVHQMQEEARGTN